MPYVCGKCVNMDENRLTKTIFNYDYSLPGGKSSSPVLKLF